MIKSASQFSGIGAFECALENLKLEHENVMAVEFCKYARLSFLANFKEPKHYFKDSYDADYENVEQTDIFLSSPPCQAFSLAGKRLGELDKRGILFYETYRFISVNQPKVFIIENVKGLLSAEKGTIFQNWIELLGRSVNGHEKMFIHEDSLEYNLHYTVLNSKNFGVPQNRERVFIVGIRKDLPNDFRFPIGWRLDKRLRDVLETNVEEKYYLSDKMLNTIMKPADSDWNSGKMKIDREIATALSATMHKMHRADTDNYVSDEIHKLGFINQDTQASKVYGIDGISPTLSSGTHGYAQGYIQVKEATKKGYDIAEPGDSINISIEPQLNQIAQLDGFDSEGRIYDSNGLARTIKDGGGGGSKTGWYKVDEDLFNSDILAIFTRNTNYGKILLELLEEIGIGNSEKWLFRITKSIEKEEILQQRLYETSIYQQTTENTIRNINSSQQKKGNRNQARIIMRSLQGEEWERCSPQRRKSIKQLIIKLDEIMQELSYKNSQRYKDMQIGKLPIKSKRLWFLRETLSEVQKIRKSVGLQRESTHTNSNTQRIRRLLPIETFRLQGFSDEFFYKCKEVNSDTQLYRQSGNTITVSVIQAIINNLKHLLK